MPIRRLLTWGALALAGLGLVAGLALATTRLAAEPVGLSSEPLAGGDRLAPAAATATATASAGAPARTRRARPAVPAARRTRTRTRRPVRRHQQLPSIAPASAVALPSAAPVVTTSTATTAAPRAPVVPAATTPRPAPAASSSGSDGKNDSQSTPGDSSDGHGRAGGDD